MPSPCTIDTARTSIPRHCEAACGRGNLQENVAFCIEFGPIRDIFRIGRWRFINEYAYCRLPRRFAPRNDIVGVCVAIRRLWKGHALSLQYKYELFDKSEFGQEWKCMKFF